MSAELRGFTMAGSPDHEAEAVRGVDSAAYRDTMALMGVTVCLVTATLEGERLGRTVSSVLSLSARKPAILVSVDTDSRLAAFITRTRSFSFAMFADNQQEVADAFAGRVDPGRRFDTGEWCSWSSGHPRLVGAVATMDCKVIGTIETGSNTLFAGGVVDLDAVAGRAPLIWHRRQYRSLGGTAGVPPSGGADQGPRI